MVTSARRTGWLIAVLVGGGTAATLDMIYACVRNGAKGRTPMWVMQSVASGLLGEGAFETGASGALLGLACHYAILLTAAFLYLQASLRLPVLRSHVVASGALFGILVYLFMNFVVLPLSAFPFDLSYPAPRLAEGF